MTERLKKCLNCGIEYKQCRSCEETYSKYYFTWRSKYCSPVCMQEDMSKILERGEPMRVHYNTKTYTVKDYDLNRKTLITTDDTKLKFSEASAIILTPEDFSIVLNHAPKTTKNVETNVEKGAI